MTIDPLHLELEPVAHVRGGRTVPTDDGWDAEICAIELVPRFDHDSLLGLDAFSHVEVVYQFHQVSEDAIVTHARHPRERTDWPKVGIFAQRGRVRPNRLGVTVCRLVEVRSTSIIVQGLDAIDGTPVLDIKPYLTGFAPRGDIVEPAWAAEIMDSYW
jgi:tRNA (adenine37-N6)-methyltransferase